MSKEIAWYEVIDLTSYGVKYPTDWYKRCGHNSKLWDTPVYESLGNYSTMEKASACLKRWAAEKGLDPNQSISLDPYILYYENDYGIVCKAIEELGIWYDIRGEITTEKMKQCYGTAAMIVKKTLELDKD